MYCLFDQGEGKKWAVDCYRVEIYLGMYDCCMTARRDLFTFSMKKITFYEICAKLLNN